MQSTKSWSPALYAVSREACASIGIALATGTNAPAVSDAAIAIIAIPNRKRIAGLAPGRSTIDLGSFDGCMFGWCMFDSTMFGSFGPRHVRGPLLEGFPGKHRVRRIAAAQAWSAARAECA
jgi:hypothetical protein